MKQIGKQLKERGILPWLDEWELRPGFPWQKVLEEQIEYIKAAAVFIGKSGRGPWREMELRAFIQEFVKRECPVIPVILPDCDVTTIQRQQAKRQRRYEEILRLVDIAPQPVLEDKGEPLPHIQVVKRDGVSGKEWHVLFTSSEACHG